MEGADPLEAFFSELKPGVPLCIGGRNIPDAQTFIDSVDVDGKEFVDMYSREAHPYKRTLITLLKMWLHGKKSTKEAPKWEDFLKILPGNESLQAAVDVERWTHSRRKVVNLCGGPVKKEDIEALTSSGKKQAEAKRKLMSVFEDTSKNSFNARFTILSKLYKVDTFQDYLEHHAGGKRDAIEQLLTDLEHNATFLELFGIRISVHLDFDHPALDGSIRDRVKAMADKGSITEGSSFPAKPMQDLPPPSPRGQSQG